MKKRTSSMSRRVVSLLMSLVLTLTLVTPAAFATEVVDGDSTTIVEGGTNPADPAPGGDNGTITDTEDTNSGDSYEVQEDALLGVSLYAAEAWDGTADTDWYTNAADGTGTADKPYEISTAAQLAGLAQLANDEEDPQYFAEKTIKLMADIKLNDDDVPEIPDENADTDRPNEWMPIAGFYGTFDGNGHTISGLYVTETAADCGLFAFAGESSTIQNLIVKGTLVVGVEALDAGGVVAAEYGVLRNCGFYGRICVMCDDDGNGCSSVGGVVGYIDATNADVQNGWYYNPDGEYPCFALGDQGYDWDENPNCFFDNLADAVSDGTAMEAMNANLPKGCLPWRMGTEHPEFLGENDKMVNIRPYVESSSSAEVMIDIGESAGDARYKNSCVTTADCNTIRLVVTNGCSEKIYVKSDLTKDIGDSSVIEVTKTGVEYTLTEQITTLYYGTADDFDSGAWFDQHTGEQSDPYIIRTAAQLRSFSRKAAEDYNFTGKFITLVSDIDLECVNWDTVAEFDGIFDGGGYSIRGLKVNAENIQNAGMFGKVTGTVRNLTVCGEVVASKYKLGHGRVGGIIGYLSGGAINNCVSRVTVTATQFQTTAGSWRGCRSSSRKPTAR